MVMLVLVLFGRGCCGCRLAAVHGCARLCTEVADCWRDANCCLPLHDRSTRLDTEVASSAVSDGHTVTLSDKDVLERRHICTCRTDREIASEGVACTGVGICCRRT